MSLAPAIISDRGRMSSDYELAQKVENQWNQAHIANFTRFKRNERNWRAYTGTDGGAHNEKDMERYTREQREAQIFNMCRPKVDTLTGYLMSELYDFDWMPAEGKRTTTTEKVKDTYYIDKELFDYADNIGKTIRDGNVHRGECKIEIYRGHKGMPRIRIAHKNPIFILRDPYWIDEDDGTCDNLFETFFLDANTLRNIYHAKGPTIETALMYWKHVGGEWTDDHDLFGQVERETKGHLFKVIEHHWMDWVSVTTVVGRPADQETFVTFPHMEDSAQREAFMLANKIDPLTLKSNTHMERIHRLTTICPALGPHALLENGDSEMQIGRLPYFHFSNCRINGEDYGLIDNMIHIQQTIDKREMKLTDLIATAQGGGKLVSRDAFPEPAQRTEFEERNSDPSYIGWVDGEELNNRKIIEYVNQNQFPAQIINQLERMYTVVDRITMVPLALESQTESASEPGVVYDRKIQMAKISLMLLSMQVKRLNNHLAEGYYYLWRTAYAGPKRELFSKDGTKSVVLNERVVKNGKIYIKNAPGFAPRCSTYVTESPQSITKQGARRIVYSELYKESAKTHPEYATLLITAMLMNMPELEPQLRDEIKNIGTLQKIRDLAKIKADIAGLDAQTQAAIMQSFQAQMGLQQLMGQAGMSGQQPVEESEFEDVSMAQ